MSERTRRYFLISTATAALTTSGLLSACGGGGGSSGQVSPTAASGASSTSAGSGSSTASSSSSSAAFTAANGYRFASDRLGTPGGAASVDTTPYRLDVAQFWSPDWEANHFRIAIPAHYTDASGKLPSETPAPNPIHIEGVTLQALINGNWVTQKARLNGAESFTLDPATNAVGVLLDDVTFASALPAATQMMVRIASNVAVNAKMLVSAVPNQLPGMLEWATASATSLAGGLMETTRPTGDGRLGGSIFTPSFIVARPVRGLDRPVVWVNGDSIGIGRNALETTNDHPRNLHGFIGVALDDKTRSRRLSHYNMCVPSVGMPEQQTRSGWSRKLDLIRLVPNRPYTHMITQHYNNGGLDSNYHSRFSAYYQLMLDESRAWGDAAAPLYQTRPIPRPGTGARWCVDPGVQSVSDSNDPLSGVKWAQFDADLVAGRFSQLSGAIPTNTYYALDQTTGRNKVRIPANIYTLVETASAGSTTLSLTTAPSIGDMLILDPTAQGGGAYVRAVSGSGPFQVRLYPAGPAQALPAGKVLPTSYVGDHIGLHPSTRGHEQIAQAMIDWKAATL